MTETPRFQTSKSIFAGCDQDIARALNLRDGEHPRRKSTCTRLSAAPVTSADMEHLIFTLYDRICANWSGRVPSSKNWQLRRRTIVDLKNQSPEVLLERAVVRLNEAAHLHGWSNQMPVASGLIDARADKRAAVDLVHFADGIATLYELKWESDTPAFAAFEILQYGLTWLFFFSKRDLFGVLERPIFTTSQIGLRVLAPRAYYAPYDLSWLGHGLNQGLRKLAADKTENAVSMDFGFAQFPETFDLPFQTGQDVEAMFAPAANHDGCAMLANAVNAIRPHWTEVAQQWS